jgi:hypothetical protein
LRVQAPLASHMAKAWDVFGFNAEERQNPFAEREQASHRSERPPHPQKPSRPESSNTSKFDPHKLSKRDPLKRDPQKRSEKLSGKGSKPPEQKRRGQKPPGPGRHAPPGTHGGRPSRKGPGGKPGRQGRR